jgi:hypothetical protein
MATKRVTIEKCNKMPLLSLTSKGFRRVSDLSGDMFRQITVIVCSVISQKAEWPFFWDVRPMLELRRTEMIIQSGWS